jgi:hypothetical protein
MDSMFFIRGYPCVSVVELAEKNTYGVQAND